MNQITNLVQFKNLTDEEKAGFDFDGYKYEWQDHLNWHKVSHINEKSNSGLVHRLVIEPDNWYYCEWSPDKSEVLEGLDLAAFNTVEDIKTVRPATADEMPKPETLEDRIRAEYSDYVVVMLEWYNDIWSIERSDGNFNCHTVCQSMRGFYSYLYEEDDGGGLYMRETPIFNALHPIAVILSKVKG